MGMRDNRRMMKAKAARGSALLEVMLAVAVMAVSSLGLVITQLSLARNTQWATAREHAAFIADAFAESAQESATGSQGASQWKTRMSTILPGSAVSLTTSGTNTFIATVSWPATPLHVMNQDPDHSHATPTPARLCVDTNVPENQGRACAAIAFAP
jgi:Tfp pilus assembly protein PilV